MIVIATDFVHLHVHTEYSLLDGANRIKDLVKKVKELGMKAVAITDHGSMYGVIDFYKECIKNDIKPIIGCEVYAAPRTRFDKEPNIDDKLGHLILLAKNNEGYKNLIKLVSEAFIDGYYYKPRVDNELLRKYSDGLICTSACLAGFVSTAILEDNYDKAKEIALEYIDIFGKDNFYLELQYNGISEQVLVNQKLIEMSRELDIPLIATNDAHYLNREDSYSHEVLLCIQTAKKMIDEDRMKFGSDEFYIKSPEEMFQNFKNMPEVLENTVKIADRCNVSFEFGHTILPNFNVPNNEDHYEFMKRECYTGLKKRYKNITKELEDRLEYELETIKKMGYIDYFLIVWDFIKYAKVNGIPVGPGRGSGAGSIAAYCLEITDIDPIKYNLIFERFLNPERISMPDFDIDFCYERRQDVIDYVTKKYGSDHVAQIITFGTMAARGVIRDVARALNVPYAKADMISKNVPMELHMTLDKALEMNPDLKLMYEEDPEVKEIIEISKRLEGMPRHASTHAAGVVITKEAVDTYVPLYKSGDIISTQYTMTILEDLGLLKMDFLGLRTLTVLKDAKELIKNNRNIDAKCDEEMNDPKVYKLWVDGNTSGIFQFESGGMTSFMKELRPDCLEDLIAGVSLYRPGPMDQIPRYIRGKNNPEQTQYTHPCLEPILNVTYGCMVYQEQVMQIVRDIGGYSLGRADIVRRAMGKKKLDVMAEERKNFIYGIQDKDGKVILSGAIRNGVDEKSADKIFDEMAEFAKYAFNKSHAACYAVIAYETAYLKAYYPTEFMASLLNSFITALNRIPEYINECKRLNINVRRPDINKSFGKFTVDKDDIIFGLEAIKNVGEGAINAVVNERQKNGVYKDFLDFCERISSEDVNKKCIESMIKAGAFDSLNINRRTLISSFEGILDAINSDKKRSLDGQITMFDLVPEDVKKENMYKIEQKEEYNKMELLSMEKDMLGLYISGHPLDNYIDEISKYSNIFSRDFEHRTEEEDTTNTEIAHGKDLQDGQEVKFIGIISHVKTKITKNNEIMAFLDVEDLSGTLSVLVFAKTYAKYREVTHVDNIVKIIGRLSIREDDAPTIVALKIEVIEDTGTINNQDNVKREISDTINKKIKIIIPSTMTEEQLTDLREYIKKISNENIPNGIIEIQNDDKVKKLPSYVDEDIFQVLKSKVGYQFISYS